MGQGESGNVPYLSVPLWREGGVMMVVCMHSVTITAKQTGNSIWIVLRNVLDYQTEKREH